MVRYPTAKIVSEDAQRALQAGLVGGVVVVVGLIISLLLVTQA